MLLQILSSFSQLRAIHGPRGVGPIIGNKSHNREIPRVENVKGGWKALKKDKTHLPTKGHKNYANLKETRPSPSTKS
jgi:hypothetical protein